MYSLTLPYPPSVNHYLRRGKRGVYQTPEAAAYKEEAALTARLEGIEPLAGEVVVVMEIYRPRKVGDIDGVFKLVFDSLNGVAWEDDRQIVELTARRHDDKRNPRIELVIWSKEEEHRD